MIKVTKEEAALLRKLFPEYTVARTMIQKSKRHRYYATESYRCMKAISGTNQKAAEIARKMEENAERLAQAGV